MILLQALVLLASHPAVGTTIAYDFRAASDVSKLPALEVRITERVDAARADGTLEVSRLYSDVALKGGNSETIPPEAVKGIQSMAGKRDRYTVGADGLWKPATLNTELGFPDFPLPEKAVPVGATWPTNGNLRDARARLKEIRTFAGHRAAIIDFLPNLEAKSGDRIGSDSYWVLDLADGRPLFARVSMVDADPEKSGAFTIVRRDVPGLVPKL